MSVGIIRTGGPLSARADTSAIRLRIAALPHSLAGPLRFALSAVISVFRVLGPIQCKAIAHAPFAEIDAGNRTGCDRPTVSIKVAREQLTGHRAMKASRSFAACAPQRYCELSSPRHSWLLSGASMRQSRIWVEGSQSRVRFRLGRLSRPEGLGRACCRGACCFILRANTARHLAGTSAGIGSNRRIK
jgi:hypothetical protein